MTAADARFANARLATFFSGVLIALLAWHPGIPIWWLLAPVSVFVWLVRRHDRVLRARELTFRGIEFYERGLARLEDRWAGTGEPGERFRDDDHVYANDLDLFGRGSLFELLSLARTRTGEAMLAGWLTVPADPAEIQGRQAAVEELASMLDLREQLALSDVEARASLDTDPLLDWPSHRCRHGKRFEPSSGSLRRPYSWPSCFLPSRRCGGRYQWSWCW